MANYTASDIKELREQTGAGMLDVKKALDEANGDKEKAIEIIRVKGLKGITKREGRAVSAGLVVSKVVPGGDGQIGYLLEINSETDFVAKNEKFLDFTKAVLEAAVAGEVGDLESLNNATTAEGKTVKELTDNLAAIIGEKLLVSRISKITGEKVTVYEHFTAKDLPAQIGVLVAYKGADEAFGRDIAMHIAAYSPLYISREEVPEDVVAKERQVFEETTRNEGKPEAAIAKIVEGRLNGFFKENTLLDQAFAKDPKQSVGQVVKDAGAGITSFVRFRVGTK